MYILILYPATLLKVFISCRSFLVKFSGHLCILPSSANIYFDFFFNLYSFNLLQLSYCSKTSRTILNRYGERGQPCLVPDFSGHALSLSPFRWMLAVRLLQTTSVCRGMSLISQCLQDLKGRWRVKTAQT